MNVSIFLFHTKHRIYRKQKQTALPTCCDKLWLAIRLKLGVLVSLLARNSLGELLMEVEWVEIGAR